MRRRAVLAVLAVAVAGCGSDRTADPGGMRAPRAAAPALPAITPQPITPAPGTVERARPRPRRVRPSRALGRPSDGRLVRGVTLPAAGPDHLTWHPIRRARPNAAWRRNGVDRLVRLVQRVAREHRRAHPGAPRVLVGDLSRPRGGDFGAAISGGVGHASHQNGLDVDVYYPRRDRRARAPRRPSQVDRRLAQDLVDRFVAAGAQLVFTGPSLGLRGPSGVVQPLAHHDDHLHVRLPPARAGGSG